MRAVSRQFGSRAKTLLCRQQTARAVRAPSDSRQFGSRAKLSCVGTGMARAAVAAFSARSRSGPWSVLSRRARVLQRLFVVSVHHVRAAAAAPASAALEPYTCAAKSTAGG